MGSAVFQAPLSSLKCFSSVLTELPIQIHPKIPILSIIFVFVEGAGAHVHHFEVNLSDKLNTPTLILSHTPILLQIGQNDPKL